MAEKTQYVIELNDKLSPGLKKATAKAMGLDKAMSGVGGKAKKAGGGLGSIAGSLKGLIGPLALAAAGMKAFQFASDSIKVAREFENLTNAITFASGSAEEGAKNMDFLRQRSNLLGTDLMASAEGFKQFSGAMIGTSLEGQATRDIFDGVQVAASVMGLGAEESKGAFLALSQMMGKGKVSAEELRGQLGERIPGAFSIAARAIGVTTSELDKMMSDGKLMAEDFLPKFSNELKKTFGPGLEKSVNSSQAQFNRFGNFMTEIKIQLGSSLMPALNSALGMIQKVFKFLQINAGVIRKSLEPLFNYINDLKLLVVDFFNRLSGGATITETLQSAFSGLQSVLQFLQPLWEAAIPIFKLVFDGIIKIKDAVIGLFKRFPIIGKMFKGFVSLIREGFLTILTSAKKILGGVGDLLAGIFSGNVDQIKKGLSGIGDAFTPVKSGQKLAGAFSKGFNEELVKDPLKLNMSTGPTKKANFTDVLKNQSLLKGAGAAAAGTGTGGKGKKASSSVNGIKSGRPTNINIDIGKLVETMNITATNLDDMNNKAKDLVAQALMSAVNNANLIAQ